MVFIANNIQKFYYFKHYTLLGKLHSFSVPPYSRTNGSLNERCHNQGVYFELYVANMLSRDHFIIEL